MILIKDRKEENTSGDEFGPEIVDYCSVNPGEFRKIHRMPELDFTEVQLELDFEAPNP
jgi:hypothetical protein